MFILVVFHRSFFLRLPAPAETPKRCRSSPATVSAFCRSMAPSTTRGVVLIELKRFKEMPWVKAVVVRIDSPGGAVAPTQEIFEEIQRAKKKKPLIASMGGMATSGGYYIAAACDKIVANPGTLTGSIGVIMQLTNVEELMKKIGVKGLNIKSGANKDIGSPFQAVIRRKDGKFFNRWWITSTVNSSPRWPRAAAWTKVRCANLPTAGSIPARKPRT